jgi:Tol biopolymer transport system component
MKMHKNIFFLATIFLAGCAPAQVQASPTATVPAATIAPPATSTPQPAPTETPIPAPTMISSQLMMVGNEEIRIYYADGAKGPPILSQESFRAIFPLDGEFNYRYAKLSPDGKKVAVQTCFRLISCSNAKLFIHIIGTSFTATFTNYKEGAIEWSPASDRILLQDASESMSKFIVAVSENNFGSVTNLPAASAAFWSYDGKQIYYYDNGWFVVNNDGTDKHTLKCDLCALAQGSSTFAVAQSPDGTKVAIGYIDGTVIITTPDMADFKLGNAGGYVNELLWSPDSTKLAVDANDGSTATNILILDPDGKVIERMSKPEGVNFLRLCGWAPNSAAIDYVSIIGSGYDFYLQLLGGNAPLKIMPLETDYVTCPIWLTGNP